MRIHKSDLGQILSQAYGLVRQDILFFPHGIDEQFWLQCLLHFSGSSFCRQLGHSRTGQRRHRIHLDGREKRSGITGDSVPFHLEVEFPAMDRKTFIGLLHTDMTYACFVQDDAFLTYILLQAFYPEDIVKGTQKDLDGIRLSLCGPGQDTPHDDRGQVLPGLEPFH